MNILVDGQTLETPEVNRGIGVYFKNVLCNMIKHTQEHNWYITVSDAEALKKLDSFAGKQLMPIVNEVYAPGSNYAHTKTRDNALKLLINRKNIDILYIPNPLMGSILFQKTVFRCKTIITLFDIIPYVLPECIKNLPETAKHEYNRRLDFITKNKIPLLSISNYTKSDFRKHFGTKNNIYVTKCAVESSMFYRIKPKDVNIDNPYIMFTGGFDYRKNLDGAIKAFAKTLELYPNDELINRLKLIIVCAKTKESENELNELAIKLGVREKVHLTGFLSDAKLVEMYQNALLFFFPSLYEGFGMPILEAMMAGIPVLCADNSSLREVCGKYAMTCDGNDIMDMAVKLKESVYKSIEESSNDRKMRHEYARSFTWEDVAEKTLKAFENEVYGVDTTIVKKKMAIITPWPKQESGVANYVYMLLPNLSKYFDIDIFIDNTKVECEYLPNDYGSLYMINELDQKHKEYDILLYQIGNSNDYHTGVYRYMKKYQGIAEIHDFMLDAYFSWMANQEGNPRLYNEAFIDGYGKDRTIRKLYKNKKHTLANPDVAQYPMCHSVANISKKAIFHNRWSSNQVFNSIIIPLACFDSTETSDAVIKRVAKKIGGKADGEIIVGVFGFANLNKRTAQVANAIKRLVDKGYNIKLVIWGKLDNPDILGSYSKHIKWFAAGYTEKEEYMAGFSLSDIVVNLRYPSMGESSGTLCEAMKNRKAVLVSEVNQYNEFPDEVCWKVPPDEHEVDILVEYISHLIDNKDVRDALAKNAGIYADNTLSSERIAKIYYNSLSRESI